MTKVEMIAALQMTLAQTEAKDARRWRSERRATEAKERTDNAESAHAASHREVKAASAQADRGFGLSFAGGVGGIIDKGINMGVAQKDGNDIATERHDASYSMLRADLAKSKGNDSTEDIAARRQEVDQLLDRTLNANDRTAEAIKIA